MTPQGLRIGSEGRGEGGDRQHLQQHEGGEHGREINPATGRRRQCGAPGPHGQNSGKEGAGYQQQHARDHRVRSAVAEHERQHERDQGNHQRDGPGAGGDSAKGTPPAPPGPPDQRFVSS